MINLLGLLKTNLISLIESDEIYPEIDESILQFKELPTIQDPVFWISIGLFICILSGVIFADIIRTKINMWSTNKLSPLPLGNLQSISSWLSFFLGLTIIFTSALTILNFSILKSIIFSLIVSLIFGLSMWNAIKDLMVQIKTGNIKEIDDFF